MGFADFDAARAERARQREPFGFVLGGEQFECIKLPILGDELDAVADNTGNLAQALVDSIKRNLIDDDARARFDALLRRKDDPIDGPAIQEVRDYLNEQYTGRPTTRSNGSSAGPQTTGSNSTGPASGLDTATVSPG